MPYYSWKGMNNQGVTQTGYLNATSYEEAKLQLLAQQIAPLLIKPANKHLLFSFFIQKRSLPLIELERFFEYSGTLLESGIDIISTLETCRKTFQGIHLTPFIDHLINDISSGKKLSEACQQYSSTLPAHTSTLLAVAEQTGTLSDMLLHLAERIKKEEAVKSQVKKALLAPCITLAFALTLSLCIVVIIVPQLENIMHQMGSSLPGATVLLFAFSNFLRSTQGALCLIAIFSLLITLCMIIRKSTTIARAIRKLPLIGNIIAEQEIILLLHNLSLFLIAGNPLLNSLQSLEQQEKSLLTQAMLQDIINQLLQGAPFHTALKRHEHNFSSSATVLIQLGSSTGKLPDAIIQAKELMNRNLSRRLNLLTTLVNPIAIILLGLLVVGILIAIYVPIFTMATVPR